jgi:hypothetical protein
VLSSASLVIQRLSIRVVKIIGIKIASAVVGGGNYSLFT